MLTAKEIAAAINATGNTYFGKRASGWEGNGISRVYFGTDYVTIEASGEVHCRKDGKARAKTIGSSGVEMVEQAIAAAATNA